MKFTEAIREKKFSAIERQLTEEECDSLYSVLKKIDERRKVMRQGKGLVLVTKWSEYGPSDQETKTALENYQNIFAELDNLTNQFSKIVKALGMTMARKTELICRTVGNSFALWNGLADRGVRLTANVHFAVCFVYSYLL